MALNRSARDSDEMIFCCLCCDLKTQICTSDQRGHNILQFSFENAKTRWQFAILWMESWRTKTGSVIFFPSTVTWPWLQRLPSISLKKTSGGVSWRWHGESYRKGKIFAPFVLLRRFGTEFHAWISPTTPVPHLGSTSAALRRPPARPWRLTNQWNGSRPWLPDLMSR